MGAGSIIATSAGTIYGGSGAIAVYLQSGNFWADLVAGIGYTSETGVVTITVLTPDEDVVSLGSISGSGSSTLSRQLTYAPAGTYYFYFSSTNSEPMEVYARIYD